MPRYYISSGLWRTDSGVFESDRDAWETLRKVLPHKYVILYKQRVIPLNKSHIWLEKFRKKYTYPDDPSKHYVPIMFGATSHKWGFEGENIE